MVDDLCGKWRLEASDNFEEFLVAIGCNFILRKAAIAITPDMIIGKEDGDRWSIKVRSTFKNSDTFFKVGEEFEETTIDGRQIKSLFTVIDGNKLHNDQKCRKTGKLQCSGTRQLVDGKLTEFLIAGNVKSTRTYFKVE